ncbi:MAG: hypothetical protein AAGM38_19005, partial [Pseudomonadota bacterium]
LLRADSLNLDAAARGAAVGGFTDAAISLVAKYAGLDETTTNALKGGAAAALIASGAASAGVSIAVGVVANYIGKLLDIDINLLGIFGLGGGGQPEWIDLGHWDPTGDGDPFKIRFNTESGKVEYENKNTGETFLRDPEDGLRLEARDISGDGVSDWLTVGATSDQLGDPNFNLLSDATGIELTIRTGSLGPLPADGGFVGQDPNGHVGLQIRDQEQADQIAQIGGAEYLLEVMASDPALST